MPHRAIGGCRGNMSALGADMPHRLLSWNACPTRAVPADSIGADDKGVEGGVVFEGDVAGGVEVEGPAAAAFLVGPAFQSVTKAVLELRCVAEVEAAVGVGVGVLTFQNWSHVFPVFGKTRPLSTDTEHRELSFLVGSVTDR